MERLLKEEPVSLLFWEGGQKWPWGAGGAANPCRCCSAEAGKAAAIKPWWGLPPA